MYAQFCTTWQTVIHSIAAHTRRIITLTKLSIVSTLLVTTSFVPLIAFTGTAHADAADCTPGPTPPPAHISLSGSSWLNGGGVNICNNGSPATNDYGDSCLTKTGGAGGENCPSGTVYLGEEWQCVELVNRLYFAKGWLTSILSGDGNTIKDDVHNHTGLTLQLDGAISYLNPGDIITLDGYTYGHAGIINSIGSGTYPIHIKNQNADLDSSAKVGSGSLSGSNADLEMNGWYGYEPQSVIHHPATTTASNRPGALARSSTDMDTFYQSSSGNNLVDLYWNSTDGWASTYWGDSIASAPSAIARTSTTMDVFFRNTGNNLAVRYWNSSTGWNSAALTTNGHDYGDPGALYRTSSDMSAFYKDNSNNLVDEYWDSTNGWNSTYWGDNISGTPSAISRDSSDMDIFFRNTSNNLVDRYWNSSTGWNTATKDSSGHLTTDPSAIDRDSSDMDIFYGNLDDEYWNSTDGWSQTYWSW